MRHLEFLSLVEQFIGSDFVRDRVGSLRGDTSFASLNFSMLDECWLEHLVRTHYGIPIFSANPWPPTIGDLLDIIDMSLQDFSHPDAGFADTDNLILVSYAGGACGHAMRYLLLSSPDTDGYDGNRNLATMERLGSAHQLLSRSGIGHMRNDRFKPLCMMDIPDTLKIPPLSWYDDRQHDHLIAYTRYLINSSITANGRDTKDWQKFGTWVWSDHIPPVMASKVFPKAKIIALYRNPASLARDFALKYSMEPIEPWLVDTGFDPKLLNIDYQVSRNRHQLPSRGVYKDYLTFQFQWQVHMQEVVIGDATKLGVPIIDIDELLDPATRTKQYDRLMMHTGLTPNYADVNAFLDAYCQRQYDRRTWTPDPDWNWVKCGPNQPGLW